MVHGIRGTWYSVGYTVILDNLSVIDALALGRHTRFWREIFEITRGLRNFKDLR